MWTKISDDGVIYGNIASYILELEQTFFKHQSRAANGAQGFQGAQGRTGKPPKNRKKLRKKKPVSRKLPKKPVSFSFLKSAIDDFGIANQCQSAKILEILSFLYASFTF